MQRYDLRHLKADFYDRMGELIEGGLKVNEVGIFLFEVGDYDSIQKSADRVKEMGHELLNSLKFNEVDWTIVVKKLDEQTIADRKEAARKAAEEAEAARKAAEEAAAKKKAELEAKKAEEAAKKAAEEAANEASDTETKAE